jgi:long-subunit fatty acid transport protein
MKRAIIVFIMLATTGVAGNAQFFVGGSVGISYTDTDTDTENDADRESSVFSIDLSPQLGYWLNDNLAVGTSVTFSKAKDKVSNTDFNLDSKHSRWRISAFSRYKLWKTGKFSLLLDGSLYYEKDNHVSSSELAKSSNHSSKISIYVFPAITYDLNEKFSIMAVCDFLSMDLYSVNGKNESTNTEGTIRHKTRTGHFNFGAQSSIFSSLTNVNIGFIYNF